MSDTEQGDIVLETQQESDSSAEGIVDTQDTHATVGHRRAMAKRLTKETRKFTVVFSDENKQKLVDFLCDNEIFYNKHLKNYKDRSKRESVWDKFVRSTTWTKMPAKSCSRTSAHSSGRSLT